MPNYVIGVDVGSGSVRAGVFNLKGKMLGLGVRPIKMRCPEPDFFEQSSGDIWKQTCAAVKQAVKDAGVSPDEIGSIAFDATCSLVLLDQKNNPVSAAKDNNPFWNIIMWMDHRSQTETDEINALSHSVLKYVGGKMSVEMEIPKILWLKRNLPQQYSHTAKFFDLADFLQYKACGSEVRSSCTVTCKWIYLAHEQSWNQDFFTQCGLSELLDGRIGTAIEVPGKPLGLLKKEAAKDLGLSTQCVCVVGMIDAHAGGLGSAGNRPAGTLSIIAGTSACHMLNTKTPIFVPGVWGPYYNAMIEGLWLNEGGQSAAGSLLDYTIQSHAFYHSLCKEAKALGKSPYDILNKEVQCLKQQNKASNAEFHLLGYHHGNRSPRADATLRGMACGMTLDTGKENLALTYLAAIQSICYGTRHIIEESIKAGHEIKHLVICGGATKNPLWLQELSDITGYMVETPKEPEAVLLGSAILAASVFLGNPTNAAKAMCQMGTSLKPNLSLNLFHEKKYRVFLEMYADQMKYRALMEA